MDVLVQFFMVHCRVLLLVVVSVAMAIDMA